MTRKVKEMCSALKAKGFREDKTHHKAYWLFVDGKKTSIKTFFSHGANEYGANLLAKVRKQMKLSSNSEFDQFMDCEMDGVKYLERLKTLGAVVVDKESKVSPSVQKNQKSRG